MEKVQFPLADILVLVCGSPVASISAQLSSVVRMQRKRQTEIPEKQNKTRRDRQTGKESKTGSDKTQQPENRYVGTYCTY